MKQKLPFIVSADDLLDRAFRRAKKKNIQDPKPFYKRKKTIITRTESFATTIISTLETYIKEFPSLNQLPLFYQDLINIQMSLDDIRKSLGAVNWAKNTCQQILSSQLRTLKRSRDLTFIHTKQKEIYGRIASVLKQIDSDLLRLKKITTIIKTFPSIEDQPTIVIAGYPNVGKSSLLRVLSHAKPQVAQYPFTTKEIHVGHIEQTVHFTVQRYQIIDTPGLLERHDIDRNKIEQQALAALQHLADIILFLLDPTETCGYSITDQQKLLLYVQEQFSSAECILLEGKSDLYKTSSKNRKISCVTHEGIDDLKTYLFSLYPQTQQKEEEEID